RSPAFYLSRLARMDPVLTVFALIGLAGATRLSKLRGCPPALLGFCWVLVVAAALYLFQARHLPYIAFVLPGLCVVGALRVPSALRRPAVVAIGVLILFSVKAIGGGQPWSLRSVAPPLEAVNAMRRYCDLHRDTELIS